MNMPTKAPARASNRYRAGLLPGRFQIVTEGHLADAIAMSEVCDRCYVGIGSVNQARDTRNPWTFEERVAMWRAALPAELHGRFRFFGQEDLGNPIRWASAIENRMDAAMRADGLDPDADAIGLFGHRKDATSFYLDDFPAWIFENLPNVDGINASDIREGYFRIGDRSYERWEFVATFEDWRAMVAGKVPEGVIEWLRQWRDTGPAYGILAEEASRDASAMAPWRRREGPDDDRGLPHDVIFNDAAAILVQGNRVLLHRRRSFPGKGNWALPEGRIDLREEPLAAAIRIAVERTGIDLSETQLRKAHRDTWFKADAWRTTRGRAIVFPSLLLLTPTPKGRTPDERRRSMALPRVKASPDVGFFTFDEVRHMRPKIHGDHAILIDQAIERLGIIRTN